MGPGSAIFAKGIFIEIIFTAIVALICFAIYFKTKESYELTKQKGIKFFREAFLMFAIAFILRFAIMSTSITTNPLFNIFRRQGLIFFLFLVLISYLSTVAIIYLLLGSQWKRVNTNLAIILTHSVAALLALITTISRSHKILLYLQSTILISAFIFELIKTKKKKITKAKRIYLLIFISWLTSLWFIGPRIKIFFEIKLLLLVLLLAVFFEVYHRLVRWLN